MLGLVRANSLSLLLGTRLLGLLSLGAAQDASQAQQHIFTQPRPHHHQVDPVILAALEAHDDPVDAFIALLPESEAQLAEPRLLHVAGEEAPQWMTEGDKMRLRRRGLKFADITDHEDFYAQHAVEPLAGKASKLLPRAHTLEVKPVC